MARRSDRDIIAARIDSSAKRAIKLIGSIIDDEAESLGNRLKAAQIMVDWSLKQTERDIKNPPSNDQASQDINARARRIQELFDLVKKDIDTSPAGGPGTCKHGGQLPGGSA